MSSGVRDPANAEGRRVREQRLTFGARGLLLDTLVYLDPDEDSIDPAKLATNKNRRDSIKRLLDELEEEGFLVRWREARRGPDGRVSGGARTRWRLYLDGPEGDAGSERS